MSDRAEAAGCPAPDTLQRALESKARLLLLRERELYELRLLRGRAEEWLNALHAVWPERSDVEVQELARRATELLVGTLSFEMGTALEYRPESMELVFACSDPHAVPAGMRMPRMAAEFLEQNSVGRYDPSSVPSLTALATALNYAKFFWRCCPSYRGSRFLFLAGSSARTAEFHAFADADRDHFAMFTSHAAALLSNSLLVADVRREHAKLEHVNLGLDASLSELRETRDKLVASTQLVAMASRQAGMAEIATGILHNVGNVLNSVNVCSEVALQQANDLPGSQLRQLVDLLDSQTDLPEFFRSDPRGPRVLEYLRHVAAKLSDQQGQIAGELTQLDQHLGHVGAIVRRQQTYAKAGAAERCALPQLMEDALLLARSSCERSNVEVITRFAELPAVLLDRHRVLQILVNLISNALRALDDGQGPNKRLVAYIQPGLAGQVRLAIEDNGIGISEQDAPRLFQHGFTTRKDGHGFGLHNSVLTAKELGGQLTFQSGGRGQGATFILELPATAMPRSSPPSRAGAALHSHKQTES